MHAPNHHASRLLALAPLALLTPTPAAQGGTGPGETCQGEVLVSSTPHFSSASYTYNVGFTASTVYDEDGLQIPEPVPIGVFLLDEDNYYIHCTNECRPVPIQLGTEVDWEILGEGGGAFIDSLGYRQSAMFARDQVLYVPPRNLYEGEVRTLYVRAIVYDVAPQGGPGESDQLDDGTVSFVFKVEVERDTAGATPSYYDVDIRLDSTTSDGQPSEPPDCQAPPGCCTIASDSVDEGQTPTATLDSYPRFGLLAFQPRPISIRSFDFDNVYAECGEPPCPSVPTSGAVFDGVEIAWSVQGPGKIYPDASQGRSDTVIFEGTSEGEVTIKAVVSSAADDPVTVKKKFLIYDGLLIDQNNDLLPRFPTRRWFDSPLGNEGLSISRIGAGRETMNGCDGAPVTFEGPKPPTPDPHTYRFEALVAPEVPHDAVFGVRFSINSPYPETLAYEHIFETLRQGDVIRSDRHVRLVSNGEPDDEPLPAANHVYDDDACPEQTAHCIPGDWLEVALYDGDGLLIGTMELPIGRSWSETTPEADQDDPKTLLLAETEWIASDASAQFPGSAVATSLQGDWNATADWYCERASEDFAQVGVEVVREAGNVDVRAPGDNVLELVRPAPGQAIQAGVLDIIFDDQALPAIAVQVPATNSLEVVGDAIKAEVETQLGNLCWSVPHGWDPDNLWWVCLGVLNPAHIRFTAVTQGINLDVHKAPQDWNAGGIRTMAELHAFQLTWKERAFGDPTSIPIVVTEGDVFEFVLPDGSILHALGVTFYDGFDSLPGSAWSIALSNDYARGSDRDAPQLLAHEVGHFLGQNPHLADLTNFLETRVALAEREYPVVEAANPNQLDMTAKRLNATQSAVIRGLQGIYTRPFIPIPERRF
ncbi:MAG: hypothetical protein AAF682_13035 [Planctomycetota bacterium]